MLHSLYTMLKNLSQNYSYYLQSYSITNNSAVSVIGFVCECVLFFC